MVGVSLGLSSFLVADCKLSAEERLLPSVFTGGLYRVVLSDTFLSVVVGLISAGFSVIFSEISDETDGIASVIFPV